MTTCRYTSIDSPLNTLWIAAGSRGLVRVAFDEDEEIFWHQLVASGFDEPRYAPDGLDWVASQFSEFFAGRRTAFETPVDLTQARPFQRSVLEAVWQVPYGEVRSYLDIAWAIGKPGATRAVGSAVATNPISLVIPCHRIIRNDGTPGEYARRSMGKRGIEYKLMLLALEGVTFGDRSSAGRDEMGSEIPDRSRESGHLSL
jgi:methylated-DNA-[protein]-cysteine S-methyltransferase